MPSSWWSAPRIRTYLLFDATGLIYFIAGFIALRLIWALGAGPDSWNAALAGLSNPLMILFHLIALASVIFVGVRFFRLFPKAQPRDTGLPMPPPAGIMAALYGAWIGVTIVFCLVLTGVIL